MEITVQALVCMIVLFEIEELYIPGWLGPSYDGAGLNAFLHS